MTISGIFKVETCPEPALIQEAVQAARQPNATNDEKAFADWLLWLTREPGETSSAEVLARLQL